MLSNTVAKKPPNSIFLVLLTHIFLLSISFIITILLLVCEKKHIEKHL